MYIVKGNCRYSTDIYYIYTLRKRYSSFGHSLRLQFRHFDIPHLHSCAARREPAIIDRPISAIHVNLIDQFGIRDSLLANSTFNALTAFSHDVFRTECNAEGE